MKKNRVEEIIYTKSKKIREKKEAELDNLIAANPGEKEKLMKEFEQAISKRAKNIESLSQEVNLKVKLAEVSEIINMSYIAKTYFKKTRQWLYQRVNGNVVGGKKRAFTEAQKETLNSAIQDISKKIGSLSV